MSRLILVLLSAILVWHSAPRVVGCVPYYGESGLYNALYQSNLRLGSISRNGNAWTIRLTGSLLLGGTCDGPRVKAQLEQTALQFSTVKSVRYYVNGQPLESLLSGK